jgi:Sigma 54 modulation/S30EA ribosomal protein C terminus/Sigma 54 modulation protein / S30EA ribosomal protein
VSETKHQGWTDAPTPIQVQVSGDASPDIAAYAERRLREALADIHLPVLHARTRITRYADPALERPVIAQVNVDVNGRFVRAQISARTAREAVDLLHDRLRRRMEHVVQRTAGNWEDRRARRTDVHDHEWRHGDEPARRPPYYPRRPEEREIIRHKSVTAARCGIDDAAAEMEDLGYDFHLFTEVATGQDSVLYRSGATGFRLAQVDGTPDAQPTAHTLPVTTSDQPAPPLSVPEAVARMAVWDRPFLFFLDREQGRGAVLYHRYDGHYGLITAAEPTQGGATRP